MRSEAKAHTGGRKLIMWNMVTIDGFFEGKKSWEIDWHEYAWGKSWKISP